MTTALSTHSRLLCLLGAAAWLAAPAAAGPAADGWQKLWRNENPAARVAFRAALKSNPSDLLALRGLGVLHLQEDNEVGAMQAWRPLYKLAPSHWSATGYWPRMVDLARRTGRWTLLEGAARDVLAARSAPLELRASARLALADTAFRAGRLPEAEKQWAEMGCVRKWRVIGPFDNVSLSGFEKSYPPEREIDFSKSHPGKDGQALRWHPLRSVSPAGQCAVAMSLGDEDACVFYAVTALQSPRDQTVRLRFDPTGAGKIFVNGQLVISDETYRQQMPLIADPYGARASFRKGWNTVLVKLADDETLRAAFSLRVTSPSSDAALPLTADPLQVEGHPVAVGGPAAAGSAEPSTRSEPVSTGAASLLRQPAQAGDLEAAALLADHLRRAHDYHRAVELLKGALLKASSSGWLRWELSQVLEEDQQADEARSERDLARKHNARLIAAELDALGDDAAGVTAAERIRQLKALLKINPQSAQVLWALARAYSGAGLTGEALQAARAALAGAAGPDEVVWMHYLCLRYDRKAEAESVLANALRAAPHDEPLLNARARQLSGADKSAAAAALYQRLLQVNPAQWYYRLQLAELYQALGDRKRALQTLRVAREQRPQDAGICMRLADGLREAGSTREAIDLYRAAIRLAPEQVTLREKLQLLLGERPVVDLAPATPAGPILAAAPSSAPKSGGQGEAGVSSLVLLDEARQVVYPDYASVMRVHRIVKVFDAAAVERFQQYAIAAPSAWGSAAVERARLLKADGKVQDVTDGADEDGVAFPSLAPGDVIDITYRVQDYPRGGLARQFWTQWFFSDPGGPVKLSRYVLIAPKDLTFHTRTHRGSPEPTVKDVKEWRIREWRMGDIPAPKQEVLEPGATDAGIWLDISTIGSWRQIVQWYRDLAQPRCVPDAAIRARAAELTREARTEDEKIRALVAFVAREIQYQSTPFRLSAYVPTEGKQVLRERYGDCKDKAALLTALLSTVGVKSRMVLLSGRTQGTTPFLPSPRFNHAVALVETARGPLWVDATADQMEFGGFPSECQQVPALVIDDTTTDLVTTPALPIETNRVVETHQAVLGGDDRLTGSVELSAAGQWGWLLRSLLQRVPETARDQALRGMAAQMLPEARFESGFTQHIAEPDRPLVLGFKYQVDRYSSAAGNFLLVRLPWGQTRGGSAEALLAGAAREHDVETSLLRGHMLGSVRLEIPAGYAPQDLQPEVRGESPWGSFRITYRMDGNVLHAESEVRMTPLRVPVKEVPSFVEFLRAIEKETRKQLVLKKE